VAVGSELLLPGADDSNAAWLLDRLAQSGVAVVARAVVADDPQRIATVVDAACARADVVIVTGGLGPTEDDRTRAAVAQALGVDLERDPERWALLSARFASRNLAFGPEQQRQADRPRGAVWIDNPLGTAAGFKARHRGCLVAVLPGPPAEMRATFELGVGPELAGEQRAAIARRVIRIVGPREVEVDRAVSDLHARPGLEVTILSGTEGIVLDARASGAAAGSIVEQFDREVRRRLGADVWGGEADRLPEVVGRELAAGRWTVAVAESCTGGLLAGSFTSVPGSSGWFRGGFVVYADDLKRELTGVLARTLDEHGAVSAATAGELAQGAARRCSADFGLGVTGIAGPGGGGVGKPVGLVYVALATSEATLSRELRLAGDRAAIRGRTVTAALDLLRRHLASRARG
jgi:nicotinamide-nucleotide amidase